MGAVFRLTDENEKRLKTIDENPHKAIKIVLEGYIAHKDLKNEHKDIISKLEDLETQIENLKTNY